MALEPGTRLGPYEILSPLVAGGMGEMYRAKHLKLGRDVAITCLSHLLSFARPTGERIFMTVVDLEDLEPEVEKQPSRKKPTTKPKQRRRSAPQGARKKARKGGDANECDVQIPGGLLAANRASATSRFSLWTLRRQGRVCAGMERYAGG